jgi:hypothetical protein
MAGPASPALPEHIRLPSPKVREAMRLLVEGDAKTITDAAKVSLTRETLSRSLGRPTFQHTCS